MQIKKDIDTTKLTTMHVPGSAKYYLKANSPDDVKTGIKFAENHHIPYCIIGNGSKILFKDEHYKGLIIHNSIDKIVRHGKILQASSGVKLPRLVYYCARNSIAGFEWAADIPGTVGGAIYMNAGAFGSTISDNLIEVKVMDLSSGELKKYKKNQLKFRYRYSSFQENNRLFILEASFQVAKGSKKIIAKKIQTYHRYRLETQPIDCHTLGSIFKRTVFNGKEVSAGLLLEKTGCKKIKIGGAEVSQKHANFIINRGEATAKDILSLISAMRTSVKNKLGVNLELEIRII